MYSGFISIKSVIDRVMRHPMCTDLPYESAAVWAIDVIRLIGSPAFMENKIIRLGIEDYRCTKPEDMVFMTQARRVIHPYIHEHKSSWTFEDAEPGVILDYSEEGERLKETASNDISHNDNQTDYINIDQPRKGNTFNAAESGILTSAIFYCQKYGAPTGSVTACLYNTTGTLGSTMVPMGVAIATSDVIDVSTLNSSLALETFTFSGANQVKLISGVKYAITIEYNGGDISNYVIMGLDRFSSTYAGNAVYYDSSWSTRDWDLLFYVNVTQKVTLTNSGDMWIYSLPNIVNDPHLIGEEYQEMYEATDPFHEFYNKSFVHGMAPTNSYKFNGNYIYTSFSHGKVDLAYYGIMLDQDGVPMVPNDPTIEKAIENYIKSQYFGILADLGKDTLRAYERAEKEYCWYIGQSQSHSVLMSLDKREALSNTMNNLILNERPHGSFYRNMGYPEMIKKQ